MLLAVALVGAAMVGLAQVIPRRLAVRARRAEASRRQAEDCDRRVTRDPKDLIYIRGLELQRDNSDDTESAAVADRDRTAAEGVYTALPKLRWHGLELVVRGACLVLFSLLVGIGVVLNVGIFTALNDGVASTAATLKGCGASILELLLTLALSHLRVHRDVHGVGWQTRLAAVLGLLVVVVVGVAAYAPQRSAQSGLARLEHDNRVLTAAQHAQPAQPLAVTAARDALEADRSRLKRAEASDTVQAVVFPIGEALTAEFALDGLSAAWLTVRRRRAEHDVRAHQRRADRHRSRAMARQRAAGAAVADELWGHGVRDLPSHLAAPGRSAGVPGASSGPTAALRTRPIDLDDFAPPPAGGPAHTSATTPDTPQARRPADDSGAPPPNGPNPWDLAG